MKSNDFFAPVGDFVKWHLSDGYPSSEKFATIGRERRQIKSHPTFSIPLSRGWHLGTATIFRNSELPNPSCRRDEVTGKIYILRIYEIIGMEFRSKQFVKWLCPEGPCFNCNLSLLNDKKSTFLSGPMKKKKNNRKLRKMGGWIGTLAIKNGRKQRLECSGPYLTWVL